jgi:hypothetical protein
VPDGSHLVILLDGQSGAIASEPIAQTPVPAAGWYLNLHQGTGNNILARTAPTPPPSTA